MSTAAMERAKAGPRNEDEPTCSVGAAGPESGEASDAGFLRCRRLAYLAALPLVGNREDALDVAQDTMVRLLRSPSALDPARPWHPYVLRVVTNLVRDLWRRRRLRRAESLDALILDQGFEPADATPDPERRAAEQERRRRVARALAALDPPHREILVLRDYQDLAYADIAEVLHVPVGTVMSRLHTARLRLREALLGGGGRKS